MTSRVDIAALRALCDAARREDSIAGLEAHYERLRDALPAVLDELEAARVRLHECDEWHSTQRRCALDIQADNEELRGQVDRLRGQVDRLRAKLEERRKYLLADEERSKLTGDALYAEGELAYALAHIEWLTKERDALQTAVSRQCVERDTYLKVIDDIATVLGDKGTYSFQHQRALEVLEMVRKAEADRATIDALLEAWDWDRLARDVELGDAYSAIQALADFRRQREVSGG
ncbi:MAG: hypothetical protein ACTHU0_22130 [Kofleriaceae bacterium]